jgi:adenine-specific DNA methylase
MIQHSRELLREGYAEGTALNAASAFKSDRQLEDRRKLGAFYTPERLSQILSDWVIQTPADTVLEPSFGGCGFLQTARERLASLGCATPRAQIYGCDIDPVAFDYLANVLGAPVDLTRFVQADFLKVEPGGAWPRAFSAIVANPPYIPYQALATDRRRSLSNRNGLIPGVGGRASLWAYFLAHAVSFLEVGGRMAWVLPGAFLQADYAKPIRDYLAASFVRSAAIVLRERIFLDEGTDEETVILLADGHQSSDAPSAIQLAEATTLPDLVDLISKWDAGEWSSGQSGARPASLGLQDEERALLSSLEARADCVVLGDIANVQIGLVTGANQFFVLSREGLQTAGLEPSDCTAILAKFVAAQGVNYTYADHEHFCAAGGRTYLVGSVKEAPSPALQAYHGTFDRVALESISTFRKRKIWWQPNDGKIPDAFFPVMHHYGPRLVLNPDKITNTNTIHRVYFRDQPSLPQRKLMALSILTTFSQVSAEMVGRRYGSGVLKHEPREAERIRLLMPSVPTNEINRAFEKVDVALKAGNRDLATAIANALIFEAAGLSDKAELSAKLSSMLTDIRVRRRPQAKSLPR